MPDGEQRVLNKTQERVLAMMDSVHDKAFKEGYDTAKREMAQALGIQMRGSSASSGGEGGDTRPKLPDGFAQTAVTNALTGATEPMGAADIIKRFDEQDTENAGRLAVHAVRAELTKGKDENRYASPSRGKWQLAA